MCRVGRQIIPGVCLNVYITVLQTSFKCLGESSNYSNKQLKPLSNHLNPLLNDLVTVPQHLKQFLNVRLDCQII